jgi:acyl-CoA synthetase (AMP-forming)/AMP-acid ligase II
LYALPEVDCGTPTLPALLRHCVEHHGDTELVVTEDGFRLTYRQIDARSKLLARRMLAAGVGKGTRVAIYFAQGPEWLTTYFAVGRIGAVAVTVSTFSKPSELLRTLRHGDVAMLVVGPALFGEDQGDRLERAIPELTRAEDKPLFLRSVPYLRSIWVMGGTERAWARSVAWDADEPGMAAPDILEEVETEVHPSDALAIVYTSGSTSEPKGVIHSHGTIVRQGQNLQRCRTVVPGDRVYAGMPFFWIGGLSFTLGPTLASGATLLTQERFEAEGAVRLMKRERATKIVAWPTVAKRILEHSSFDAAELPDLGCFDGGRVPKPTGLGMTETCSSHTDPRDTQPERQGDMGWALDGVELRIVDPVSRETLPVNGEGEICVRGYNLLAGMVKVERFEFIDEEGLFHTGDRGWLNEDGILHFTGRLSDMIKHNGSNVAPAEVELALLDDPAVLLAAVVGIPDPETGEDVGALIVFREPSADVDSLFARVKERIASYKVPTRVLVMSEESVPYLAAGKIDKREVRALLAAQPKQALV